MSLSLAGMSQKSEINLASWIQLFILGIIWGSSFILIKRSLLGLSPVEVASFRISIACVALLPFVITQFRQIDWKSWHKFLFVGLTTTGIPSFCFAFAQTHVDSATAGILNALTPIFTLLISVWLFNARFEWGKLAGVMIGFIGAGLLVYNAGGGVQGSNAWYSLLILVATICYGFNANAVKQFFPATSSVTVSAVAFVLVGFPALLYLIFSGSLTNALQQPAAHASLLAVTLLSLMCTVLANIVFYRLIQNTNAVFGSSVTFLIPVVASLWGLFDGEDFGVYHIISMVCILIALLIIRRK